MSVFFFVLLCFIMIKTSKQKMIRIISQVCQSSQVEYFVELLLRRSRTNFNTHTESVVFTVLICDAVFRPPGGKASGGFW